LLRKYYALGKLKPRANLFYTNTSYIKIKRLHVPSLGRWIICSESTEI